MNRNAALDYLKLALALMVVCLHSRFLANLSPLASYLTNNGLFRIAVPVFFIINGFFYNQALESGKSKEWIVKVAYIYIIWMALYSPFWIHDLNLVSNLNSSREVRIFKTLILGYHHLWYISAVICSAVLLKFLASTRDTYLSIFAVLMFSIGVVIQYAGNYHVFTNSFLDKITSTNWVHRNFLFMGFPFFCIGYLISKARVIEAIAFEKILLATFVGICAVLTESYINYIYLSKPEEFDSLVSLIIICPTIFLLFSKSTLSGNGKLAALYSSGIYLIHPAIQKLIEKYFEYNGMKLLTLTISISLISTYILIEVRKKVKFIL